jgi:NitT/TauT family transport system permease protein
LLVWELASRFGLISTLLFPAPSVITRTIGKLTSSGALVADLQTTLLRIGAGLLGGGVPGLLLGLALGSSPRLRRIVNPLIAAVHPIPKIAMLPLIMAVLGVGENPKITVAALGAFFPLLINARSGVMQISPSYFEIAQNYGASRWRVFWRVIVPGSLPSVMSGLLLALNITLVMTIAVEMVSSRTGLGAHIWMAFNVMRLEEVYAMLTVITVLGIGIDYLVHYLIRRLVPWQQSREAQ